jgi:hypothetical protein
MSYAKNFRMKGPILGNTLEKDGGTTSPGTALNSSSLSLMAMEKCRLHSYNVISLNPSQSSKPHEDVTVLSTPNPFAPDLTPTPDLLSNQSRNSYFTMTKFLLRQWILL